MTWKGSDGQVGNSSTCAMGYILHRQSYLWAEEGPEQGTGYRCFIFFLLPLSRTSLISRFAQMPQLI